MAREQDPKIQEDVSRGEENEQGSAAIGSRNNNYTDDDGANPSQTIKNANAVGLGALGKNDEKQTVYTSNHSADAGTDQ
jgi:hypothetical protein